LLHFLKLETLSHLADVLLFNKGDALCNAPISSSLMGLVLFGENGNATRGEGRWRRGPNEGWR